MNYGQDTKKNPFKHMVVDVILCLLFGLLSIRLTKLYLSNNMSENSNILV